MVENRGLQGEVESLAAAETLAVVLQGIQVVVRIQVVQGVLHDLQILVVHLQEIHRVGIQETLLAAQVLPLPQPVHLIQRVVLFQRVYLFPVQQLT